MVGSRTRVGRPLGQAALGHRPHHQDRIAFFMSAQQDLSQTEVEMHDVEQAVKKDRMDE